MALTTSQQSLIAAMAQNDLQKAKAAARALGSRLFDL